MRNTRMVTVAIALALLGGVVAGARAGALRPAETTVACDRIALRAGSGAEDGFRILLGAVAVPGAHHLAHETTATESRQWPYFRNAGVAVRGGTSAVTVTVPEGWRDRIAVSWGDSPVSSSVRFAPCSGSPERSWNAFSGGFHLRSRADCVPLLVRVGGRSTTVRVGVGRACGEDG